MMLRHIAHEAQAAQDFWRRCANHGEMTAESSGRAVAGHHCPMRLWRPAGAVSHGVGMEAVQWVGVAVIAAGVVWAFKHPTSTGEGGVEAGGFSASGLTQGGVIAAFGVVLILAPRLFPDAPGVGGGEADNGNSGSPAAPTCVVAGTVYNDDTDQAFSGVDVGLVPPGTAYAGDEDFDARGTTGPDGEFSFGCADLSEGSTFQLALSHAGWGGCVYVADRDVSAGRDLDAGAVYVSDKVMALLGKLWGLPKYDNCVPPNTPASPSG